MDKYEDRLYVARSAEVFDASWTIGQDIEAPDFPVTEGYHEFGLEVSELFRGPAGRKGVARKTEKSTHQGTINRYRKMYVVQRAGSTPIGAPTL